MKIPNPLTNVHITNDLIMSGDLSRKATLTCGFAISGVSLVNTSTLHCRNVENSITSLLQALSGSDLRIQVTSSNSGDYSKQLLPYYETSQENANRWSQLQRNADYTLFDEMIQANLLSHREVHIFLTREVSNQGSHKFSAEELEGFLKMEEKAFEVPLEQIKQAIQHSGGKAERLTDSQLFMRFDKALNPSIHPYDEGLATERFNPESSISENCLSSDMMPVDDADCGFCLDDTYHAVLALKTLPARTTSGIIAQLSSLPIKDYSINLITTPLDLEKELSKQEDQISKLQKAVSSSNKARLNTPLQKCIERLDRLSSGDIAPYKVQFTIVCWDKDIDALKNKVGTLKTAIRRFQSAQYYSLSNPVYARNFFLSSLPGSPVLEEAFMIETEDVTVANIMPIDSGSDDSLTNAEAIYQTTQGGLFGLSVFTDQKEEPYIRHGLITGKLGLENRQARFTS